MNTDAIIRDFITKEVMLGNNQKEIAVDDPLVTSGIIDSMALIRLVTFLEQTFGIAIEGNELIPDNFQTISTIKSLINKKKTA